MLLFTCRQLWNKRAVYLQFEIYICILWLFQKSSISFFFCNNLPLVKQWILFLLQMCISLVCFRTLIFKNISDNCVYLLGMCINLKYAKAESKVTLFARECASSGISGLWDRGLTKGSKAKHVWLLSKNFLVLVLKITWNRS